MVTEVTPVRDDRSGASRSVLVTGGSRGIGLAIATAFARQGDRVAIAHRGRERYPGLFSVTCDVTQPDQVDAAFATIEVRNGPVEVLVSSAAIAADAPLAAMTEERFLRVVNTNLLGAYRVARRACRPMVRRRWGRIVFVSSLLSVAGGRGAANYAASKGGLIGFARSVAREYAPYGITANLVSPGYVRTEMTETLTEQRKAELLSRIFFRRAAEPADIAGAVRWLASDEAHYVTGIDLPVDGGLGLGV